MHRLVLVAVLGLIANAVLPAQSDLFEWSLFASLDAGQRVVAIAFSSDGSKGAIATERGAVEMFDLVARPQTFHLVAQQSGRVVSLLFTSDSSTLVSAAEDGVVLVSPISGSATRTIQAGGRLLSATISRDSATLATAADDKSVAIWDFQTGRQLGSQLQHKSKKPFFALGFAEKDASLIGVGETGTICEWDTKTHAVLRQIQDSDQAVHSASIGESGNLLAIGTEFADFQKGGLGQTRLARPLDIYRENRIKLYDLSRGTVVKTLDGINGAIVSLALSPDGRFVGFVRQALKDSFLVVYDAQRGVEVASTHLPGRGVAVAFSRQGQWLGVTTDRGEVMVWAVKGISNPVSPESLRGVIYTITSANSTPLIEPSHPVPVAVMDFNANSLDAGVGRAVGDMVRTRIGEGQNVKIVERAQMDQVIKEQNIHLSDRIDPATAVKLGRMLGAGKMVFGSVSKLDTRFTINVRMVDVETGVVDGEREITCEPCVASGLQEAVIRLKRVLVK